MTELELKYGCNPDQKPASVSMAGGGPLPFRVRNGRPGYINLLDALNSWQLVRDAQRATGEVCAASFKHVSPTSAALGRPLPEALKRACFVDDLEGLDDSPLACAYARARGADRMSSFGDWIALSARCDEATARVIAREVSDGVIAPAYDPAALELLRAKRKGGYNIVEIDPDYEPGPVETREVFGVTFSQGRSAAPIDASTLANIVTKNRSLPDAAARDLVLAQIALKYTQSNSVCFATDGQVIGIGAGQQSRIHCTRLAGDKADRWRLRQHPRVLELPFLPGLARAERDNAIDCYLSPEESADVLSDGRWQTLFTERPRPFPREEQRAYLQTPAGVSLASDAFFPFPDNIERARRSGVQYIAQPGGSVRDAQVIAACDRYGIVMAFTGRRLFHH